MRTNIATVNAVVQERIATGSKAVIERTNADGSKTVLARFESEPAANRRLSSYGPDARVRVVPAAEAKRLMEAPAPYVRRRR